MALFDDLSPTEILPLLELRTRQKIVPGRTLLFLDEIQMCPRAIMALRYFYEELPDLHLVAAGSLLDFVLAEEGFSVPVGRIQYLHLGPLNFCEFLDAVGEERLAERLNLFEPSGKKLDPLHEHLMTWLRRYIMIGGVPEAVQTYCETQSYGAVDQVKEAVKPLFLDVGLMLRALGLDLTSFHESESLMTANNGAIAEQLVGQELQAAQPLWQEPSLHYWVRQQKASSAEVDYVLSSGTRIYPVEVKAGSTGHLRSLHIFLQEKGLHLGVRLGTGKPQVTEIDHRLTTSQAVSGCLYSLPLYLAGQVPRIIREVVVQ